MSPCDVPSGTVRILVRRGAHAPTAAEVWMGRRRVRSGRLSRTRLSGGGARPVESWLVAKSLINQRIALAEARSLGISVSDEQVEAAVVGILGQGVTEASLASTGGMDGLRRRVRDRLTMEAVKDNVTAGVEATTTDIRAYIHRASALYAHLPWEAARVEVEPAVRAELAESVWVAWLDHRRACTHIEILVPGIGLASIKPETACT